MIESDAIAELQSQLLDLSKQCANYFNRAKELFRDVDKYGYNEEKDYFWSKLPTEVQQEGQSLVATLMGVTARVAGLARQSPLITEADQRDLSIITKTLRACIMFRSYYHWETEPIYDEDRILGVRREGQSEDRALYPTDAPHRFLHSMKRLKDILDLVTASAASPQVADTPIRNVSRIRQDTAFIMMWMDPDHPELNDVCDVIKDVFSDFGVRAIRADDIEHEDVITARILAEIEVSEFLIADLTGARPSVYYEVGYAHAFKEENDSVPKEGYTTPFRPGRIQLSRIREFEGLARQAHA